MTLGVGSQCTGCPSGCSQRSTVSADNKEVQQLQQLLEQIRVAQQDGRIRKKACSVVSLHLEAFRDGRGVSYTQSKVRSCHILQSEHQQSDRQPL